MSIYTCKKLVIGMISSMLSIFVLAQDVEHEIVDVVATLNGQSSYEFRSSYVPFISGPSANVVGGNIQLRHISGDQYALDFTAGWRVMPDGWVSHFVFYPLDNSLDYSMQRVRLKVQESVIQTKDDFYRLEKNADATILDPISNDYASHTGLKIKAVTIINNAGSDVHHQSGELTFTPNPDFEGLARFQYLACDDLGTCELGNASVLVYDPLELVVNDTISVTSVNGEMVEMPLPHENFSLSQLPENERSIQILNGILQYDPIVDFSGVDYMTVSDGAEFFRTLKVEVISVPMGNGFIFQDVFYPIPNADLTFDVYANDFYNILSLDQFTLPDVGTLIHDARGVFTFTPPNDFVGHTSFNYSVCNGSICETASVYLFVGKQEPRKDINYHFTTAQHIPVVIDFQNDLDAEQYTLSVIEDPEFGTAQVFPFYLDPCVTFNELNDYLIYEPNTTAPVGDDYFKVQYCLNEVNICDTVEVRITTEQNLGASCSCTENCVWPGDANNDGYVDVSDLLMLGYNIGSQGDPRGIVEDEWAGYSVDNWSQQPTFELDAKYADTDGDGLVAQSDTSAIVENYGNVRSLVANRDHVLEAIPFDLYNEHYNEETQLDSGDLVTFDILLGTYDLPALEILGISFTLDIAEYPVDQNSVRVTFDDNGWLINGSPKLDLDILTDTTRIDAGITLLDRSSASGYGQVARLDFIIIDDLDGIRDNGQARPLTVRLTNGSAMTSSGNAIALPDTERTIYIKRRTGNQPISQKELFTFPNPTADIINLHLNGTNAMESYHIYSMSGQHISGGKLSGKQDQINTYELNPGLYVLQVITSKGPLVKKIEVVR